VKIGPVHGYAIEGDLVRLNAEVATVRRDASGTSEVANPASARDWALQLWACDDPHRGGPVSGIKIAEAPIALPVGTPDEAHHLHTDAFARLPADRKDYAMVLVLASGTGSALEQVHDYANFPARQPFFVPHLDGAIGYQIDGSEVTLRAGRVTNPRSTDNRSGSLVLELRALTHAGASGLDGHVLASAPLGRLEGQASFEGVEIRAAYAAPPAGEWPLALVLVEYTSEGFLARDSFRFPVAATPMPTELAPSPAVSPAAASPLEAVPATEPAPRAEERRRLSIETATVEQLTTVTGITRKLALEIVKARPYRSIDELVKARGIGDKMLRKLRDLLTV
jgi:competence protein ComEA